MSVLVPRRSPGSVLEIDTRVPSERLDRRVKLRERARHLAGLERPRHALHTVRGQSCRPELRANDVSRGRRPGLIHGPTVAQSGDRTGQDLSAAINTTTGLEPQSSTINVPILKYKQEPQVDSPATFQHVSITIAEATAAARTLTHRRAEPRPSPETSSGRWRGTGLRGARRSSNDLAGVGPEGLEPPTSTV